MAVCSKTQYIFCPLTFTRKVKINQLQQQIGIWNYIYCIREIWSLEKVCVMKIRFTESVDWLFILQARTVSVRNAVTTHFPPWKLDSFGCLLWSLRDCSSDHWKLCCGIVSVNRSVTKVRKIFLFGVGTTQIECFMLHLLQLHVTGTLCFSLNLSFGPFWKGLSC